MARPHFEDLSTIWSELSAELVREFAQLNGQTPKRQVSRKRDGSPLSDADTRIQRLIVEAITTVDSDPCVVAEEELNTIGGHDGDCEQVWVIDPIDGTTQFLKPGGNEYCSAVAVVRGGIPIACLIVCPEISRGGTAAVISVGGPEEPPLLNGVPAPQRPATALGVSATRRRGPSRAFERTLRNRGVEVKTRATSLTLDIARTCLDLSATTGLGSFDWFHRADLRAWDALAGIALARSVGLAAVDLKRRPLAPLPHGLLETPDPLFPDAIVCPEGALTQALEMLG